MIDKADTKTLIREMQENVAKYGRENTTTYLMVQAINALQQQDRELEAVGAGGVQPLQAAPKAPPTPHLLAADHQGMRVDYSGLLGQCRRTLHSREPANAEMLRQLQGHLQELGRCWYAGETVAVDEFLQLYCIEHEARAALAANGGK